MYMCTVACTGEVTFYKVPENIRPYLSGEVDYGSLICRVNVSGLGEKEFVAVPPSLEERIWRPDLKINNMRRIKNLGVPTLHVKRQTVSSDRWIKEIINVTEFYIKEWDH